ncbi:TRAP transporter substrate-binding protein [Aurantiacibacter suaedae]|uniref:TRAP transporter substrate-binding protein n=1 Tax=Aurantiacibacter suaedae TaxID=2545755 RepID=UPI0010F806E1|nr:TRAP transporter substrate-binding protein [Aurantiacibacter suaedae]
MKGRALIGRRKVLVGTGALAASLLLGGCEARMSGLLTSSDTHPADYPTVRAVEFMGRFLSERTGGRLGIKVYSGGQLGSEIDTLEITSFGGLDLNRVNLAPLNSMAPLSIPPSLPFIFNSVDHMRRTLDSDIGDEILASLTDNGLIGLCFYDSGARSFYNTRGPIYTPADMRGLKLRVPASDAYVAMVNALGANAVPIPFGEVYQALAQGVIDGAENNWPSFESARHYEVARHFSLTHHLLTPEALVMSKMKWDSLSPADQALVREAARASVPVMRKLWDARVNAARETIIASGVEVNEVDTAPFAALMRPVWEEFAASPQQRSLVERIVAAGERK